MIPSADHDPIRPSDLFALFARAMSLPYSRSLAALLRAARAGDGDAIERLARRVEEAS